MFWYILIMIIGYLIGSINLSIILSKKNGQDIRTMGSKNAGTTNTLRTMGKKYAILVLLADVFKGVIVVCIARLFANLVQDANLLIQLGAISVILGHIFPIYYGFKGGKGVATTLGVILSINPLTGVICLVFAIVLILFTKMVSLGSIFAAILYPILVIFLVPNYIIFSILVALLLIYMHRANIKRILQGNENTISFKSKKEANKNE